MGASVEFLMQFLLICSYLSSLPPPDRCFYWEGWRIRTHTHFHWRENTSGLRIYTFYTWWGKNSWHVSSCLFVSLLESVQIKLFLYLVFSFFFLCWSRFSQEIRRSRNSLQISAQEITNSKRWRWIKGNLRVCDWLAGSDVLPVRPWMLSSLPVCFKEGLALIEMWKVNVYFKIIYWNKSGW